MMRVDAAYTEARNSNRATEGVEGPASRSVNVPSVFDSNEVSEPTRCRAGDSR
jgi:hypothetical protein